MTNRSEQVMAQDSVKVQVMCVAEPYVIVYVVACG
jgi:hypothetical protein